MLFSNKSLLKSHILLLCSGLLLLIPGLIHSYHPDGGAKTIADITNYEKCQTEILWYFRLLGIAEYHPLIQPLNHIIISGAEQTVNGVLMLGLLYLLVTSNNNSHYKKLMRFILVQLCMRHLYTVFVSRAMGKLFHKGRPKKHIFIYVQSYSVTLSILPLTPTFQRLKVACQTVL